MMQLVRILGETSAIFLSARERLQLGANLVLDGVAPTALYESLLQKRLESLLLSTLKEKK